MPDEQIDLKSVPQAIYDKVSGYQYAENVWMDAYVRMQWPRWVCALAEKDGFMAALLRIFVARYSGLEVVRNKNTSINVPTKGFRPGRAPQKQMIDAITTTIFKHKRNCKLVVVAGGQKARPLCSDACVVAKQRFDLGVPL